MKIEPIDEGRLRVWLNEEETERWGLWSAPEQRVRRLVRQVMAAVGRRPCRLLAEAIPVAGGSVLLISRLLRPRAEEIAVYHLPDEDTLLSLIRQWRKVPDDTQPYCALYEAGAGYRLAVYPDGTLSPRQSRLLLEYGTLVGCGEGAAAHAAEYDRRIGDGALLTADAPHPPAPGGPAH